MKKLLTLVFIALASAVSAVADNYTDNLVVTVNGVSTDPEQTTITVDQTATDTYSFQLKNFGFMGLSLGDINLNNVAGTTVDGTTYLRTAQTVDVDLTNLYGFTATLPIVLRAEINGGKLKADMDIDFTAMSMNIHVTFAGGGHLGGFQIPNSDFETYYTYTNHRNIKEPLHWHSFASTGGNSFLMQFVYNVEHTICTDDVRPGSTGSHSLQLKATTALGSVIANGTVTTGRMNTGSMTAADVANHAQTDMSNTDKDGNGDPFYAVLNGQPDSVEVWLAFKQGTPSSSHPYATINAVTTDGTYYQDPEDKTYNNKRAQAQNNRIAATYTGSTLVWQKLQVPFSTINSGVGVKSILLTISTNADPGSGSNNDLLNIDDLRLVYNLPTVTGITVGSTPVSGFSANTTEYTVNGVSQVSANDINVATTGALDGHVSKTLKQDGANVVATIVVTSGDYEKYKTYTLTFNNATTGINNITVDPDESNAPTEIYTIDGRRVSTENAGGVYIVKKGHKVVKEVVPQR